MHDRVSINFVNESVYYKQPSGGLLKYFVYPSKL